MDVATVVAVTGNIVALGAFAGGIMYRMGRSSAKVEEVVEDINEHIKAIEQQSKDNGSKCETMAVRLTEVQTKVTDLNEATNRRFTRLESWMDKHLNGKEQKS